METGRGEGTPLQELARDKLRGSSSPESPPSAARPSADSSSPGTKSLTQPPVQLRMEARTKRAPKPPTPPPPPGKEETVFPDTEKSDDGHEFSEPDRDIQMAEQWDISSQAGSVRPAVSEAEVELTWELPTAPRQRRS